jgi:hypothetical protein
MRPIIGCALLLAALSSAACRTRKPVTVDQLKALKPDRVWVTEHDQSVTLVSGPQLVGDTLVGYVNGAYEEMPTAQFKQFVVERPATTRTVLLVTVIAAGLGGMAYTLAGGGEGNKFTPDYCEEHGEDPGCMML